LDEYPRCVGFDAIEHRSQLGYRIRERRVIELTQLLKEQSLIGEDLIEFRRFLFLVIIVRWRRGVIDGLGSGFPRCPSAPVVCTIAPPSAAIAAASTIHVEIRRTFIFHALAFIGLLVERVASFTRGAATRR
jgi:hypothetical protein